MKPYTAVTGLSTALMALALVAAACGTAVYDKPGGTYAEWKRDDTECRTAARGGDDRVAYTRCMRERGYRVPTE